MEIKSKQRVVGIVVLVIVVVLFVLLLFTGSKQVEKPNLNTNIPTSPAAPVLQKASALNIKEPQAFVVRLGSFSNENNANNLVKKLQAKGFTAYTRDINSDKGYIYQVFVGPKIDHTKANELVKKLQESMRLQGIVVEYKA